MQISALVNTHSAEIRMIFLRLKEEREKLGLTQPAMALIAGSAKRTIVDWEKGVSSPTAVQLSALSAAGFDVLYILTGTRQGAVAENKREQSLLDDFRRSSDEGKRAVESTAHALAVTNGTQGLQKSG